MAEYDNVPKVPEKVSDKSMFKDAGEKYHWVYELPMMKSFFLLFEVWRVLGIAAGIIIVLMSVMHLFSHDGWQGLLYSIEMGVLVLAILLILSIPAYYIVTKANNGKYTVLFDMDKDGVDHTQIKTDKARALETLTMLAGGAARNFTAAGSGMLSSAGGSLYSRFSNVKKIKAVRSKDLIKLNGRLMRNQVYVTAEDFDFVYNYIVEHCPNARIV